MNNDVVIFNYLMEGKESGHLILDDEFWLKCCTDIGLNPVLYTSEFSKNFQVERDENWGKGIRVLKGVRFLSQIGARFHLIGKVIKSPNFNRKRIVIQGFDELSLIIFLLKNAFGKNCFYLVMTNNISSGRIQRSNFVLILLLKIIFRWVDNIICHSEKEFEIVSQFFGSSVSKKLNKKKYHLIGRSSGISEYSIHSKTIAFFGPVKRDKPLDKFIELIKFDINHKFNYVLYNVENQGDVLFKNLSELPNVRVVNHFMDNGEYLKALLSCRYIFLSHNSKFEPKLSGNLCDCFANGIPFISEYIYPAREFTDSYGDLGFLIMKSDDSSWLYEFFERDSIFFHTNCVVNIKKVQQDYTWPKLLDNAKGIFGIDF